MAQLGLITVNGKRIIEVDADPSVSGVSASIGSIAMFNDGGVGKAYLKAGSLDTDWSQLTGGSLAFWGLSGSTLTGGATTPNEKFGSISDHDVIMVRNNVEAIRLANGLVDIAVPVSMSSQVIGDLANGVLATDAVNKGQLDAGLALKLDLAGGTMSGDIAMGGNAVTGMADPTLAQDAVTLSYLNTQLASLVTGAKFREYTRVFTADTAPANGTAVSTLGTVPATKLFDDNDGPVVITSANYLTYLAAGDYLMFDADSATPKLMIIYDDAGTLKVQDIGVTQPIEGYLYNVEMNFLDALNLENSAGYITLADGSLIKVYDYDWNSSFGIVVGSPFTPASGVIAGTDSVHVALEKLQGNIDDLSGVVDGKWDLAGNTLTASAVLGSVAGDFDITINRGGAPKFVLKPTFTQQLQDIVPANADTLNMASASLPYLAMFSNSFKIADSSNDYGTLGVSGTSVGLLSGLNGNDSRSIFINTNDAVAASNGSSGNVSLYAGAKDGAGQRGSVILDAFSTTIKCDDISALAAAESLFFAYQSDDAILGKTIGMLPTNELISLALLSNSSNSALDTGYVTLHSGDKVSGVDSNTGPLEIYSGDNQVGTGNSGYVNIQSGDSLGGATGDVFVKTGVGPTRGALAFQSAGFYKSLENNGGTEVQMAVRESANRVQTTDATPTQLQLSSTLAYQANIVSIVEYHIIARKSTGETNAYKRTLHVEKFAGNVAIVAVQSDFTSEDSTTLDISFSVSGNDVNLSVIGNVGETWDWRAKVIDNRSAF